MKTTLKCVLALLLLIPTACRKPGASAATTTQPADRDHAANAPTNRIDIPPAVRQNLGITFAKVESRRVDATLRVPGRFEPLPSARREYRTALPGRVELLVNQFDRVEPGTPLFRLNSPEWHKIRLALHEAESDIEKAQAAITVAERALEEARHAVTTLKARIEALAGAEVKRAELDADLSARRAALPRIEAELKVKRVNLDEAEHHLPIVMASAASALGMPVERMTEEIDASGGNKKTARWRTITDIEVTAAQPATIDALAVTNGAWVDTGAQVLSTLNPAALRFAATGLQADLARLKENLPATIIAPHAGAAPLVGKLALGLSHDPDRRTIDLYVTPSQLAEWARPGVSALAEIVTDDTVDPEPAIPLAAIVRDELKQVFFRRDPKNPDKVIRVEADLGPNDGKWVVVNSGVATGDEVVLDGVHELKLTGNNKPTGGGHFHADGTWHADGTPEPGGKK
jgi:hypothetical protein